MLLPESKLYSDLVSFPTNSHAWFHQSSREHHIEFFVPHSLLWSVTAFQSCFS